MKALFVGLGSIGQRHLRNLKLLRPDAQLLAYRQRGGGPVLAPGYTGDQSIEDYYGITSYTDLAAALAQKPEIAIVSNLTSLHVSLAQQLADAGCHLLIEKPLSHSNAGIDALMETVAAKNLTAMVGYQFRFHPLFLRLQEEMAAGKLGTVLGATAEWGEYMPDWHPWEDYRETYAARDDLGGGVMLTLIHPIDYLIWLFGDVREAYGAFRKSPNLETTISDDWADVLLTFESGVIANVHMDYVQKPPVNYVTVKGTLGRVTIDLLANTASYVYTDGSKVDTAAAPGFERNTLFIDQMAHFLTCVETQQPPKITLADARRSLDIVLQVKGN